MRLTEIHDGIPTAAALRESTRIQRHGGKNGNQQYIDRVDRELLQDAMQKLSGRERRIVEMRFGILPETEEKTQKEVADILGISQSYISRLEKKIMRRLKKEISKMM